MDRIVCAAAAWALLRINVGSSEKFVTFLLRRNFDGFDVMSGVIKLDNIHFHNNKVIYIVSINWIDPNAF